MNSEIFRVGQTYSFMGYDWTACELINKGKTLVIQSHGVTHGEWPGFVMPQFGNGNYWQALKEAAMNYQSFGAADGIASLGTVNGSNNAWYVYSDGYVYNDENQDYDFVVAPAFNLDLSKIEIVGDEIIIMHKENFKDEEK